MDQPLLLILFIYFPILIHVVVDLYFDAIEKSDREMLLRGWKELDEALSDDDWWLCCESAILYWRSRL